MAGLSLLVGLVDPNTHHYFGECPLPALTGIWCPACGATRASHAMLHGDLVSAFHQNALWLALAPLCLYAWLSWTLAAYGRPVLPRLRLDARAGVWLLAALAVFCVARNLPFTSFEALRPR